MRIGTNNDNTASMFLSNHFVTANSNNVITVLVFIVNISIAFLRIILKRVSLDRDINNNAASRSNN